MLPSVIYQVTESFEVHQLTLIHRDINECSFIYRNLVTMELVEMDGHWVLPGFYLTEMEGIAFCSKMIQKRLDQFSDRLNKLELLEHKNQKK